MSRGNFPGASQRNVGRYNHAGQGVGYSYGGNHPSMMPTHPCTFSGVDNRQGNMRKRYQPYAAPPDGKVALNWIEDDNPSNRKDAQKDEVPKNAVMQGELNRSECNVSPKNEPTIAVKKEHIPSLMDSRIEVGPDGKSSTAPPRTSASSTGPTTDLNHSPKDVLSCSIQAPNRVAEKIANDQQVCPGHGPHPSKTAPTSGRRNNEESATVKVKSEEMAREKDACVQFRAMNMWYWRDPEFRKHGPYPYTEMARWYKLNFFRSLKIFVRRESDKVWYPLHDLIAYLNGSPFIAVTRENVVKYSNLHLPGMTLKELVKCPAKSDSKKKVTFADHTSTHQN